MKISTFIGILAVVGVVFFLFAQMVGEANNKYHDANINSSVWNGTYDYTSTINTKLQPVQDSFTNIEESTGWLSILSSGITGIFRGIVALPILVFSAFAIGSSMIGGFFTAFGLPSYLLTVVSVILIIWGVTKLLEIIQRWNI